VLEIFVIFHKKITLKITTNVLDRGKYLNVKVIRLHDCPYKHHIHILKCMHLNMLNW